MSAGVLSQISFAKETTWGTPVTPTKSIAVRPTGGLAVKNNVQFIPAIKAQLPKNYDSIIGKRSYEGSYTFDAFGDYMGYFLLSAFGIDTPALHSGETIVYDHVFTESAVKVPLTIEQSISENSRRYTGSLVNSLKITAKTGEMIEVEASVMAKGQSSSTQIAGAFSTVPAFNFAQTIVKIGGSTIGEVESIELEYKNNVEMVYALGTNDPAFYAPKGSEITGKLELYLDASALTRFTNYLAKTRESIEVICTGGAIGSTANYVLDVLVPKADYSSAQTKINDSHNLVEIEFEGVFDTSTSKLVAVTLTNLLASY